MTTLALAAIEFCQGVSLAAYTGLERIRLELTRQVRKTEQARRMQDSVRKDLERL